MERQPIQILIPAPTKNTFRKDGHLSFDNPYIKKLAREHITPLIASPDMSQDQIADMYGRANGLLIPGGTDVEPWRYGQEPHPQLMKNLNPELDQLQLDLVKRATDDSTPLLGVCRGAQVMAVAHGGTLHQHLPEYIPHEDHGVSVNALGQAQDKDVFHDIYIFETSKHGPTKAYTLFKTNLLKKAPTKHHQAVDTPGKLIITGTSHGKIAEIVEHPTLPFHIGVQFHPELSESKELTVIFKAFAEAVKHKKDQLPLVQFVPQQRENHLHINS